MRCDTREFFEIGDDGTERVAVIRVAVQHELPALGRGDRGDNRDLAAELVGRPGLAFADAFHLGRVQRVDLGPALALLLKADPPGEIEQRAEAVLERGIALDLAADIADHAAEPGSKEFELAPGALELVGMRIAPHLDGGALGHAQIALAQFDTLAFGQIDQLLDRTVGEPGIGRMGDRLLLDGGVHHDPLKVPGLDRLRSVRHRKALLQQRRNLLLTQPLAPARQRRAIERCRVLEHQFSAEVLEIRILHPPVAQRFVREIVHVLEDQQPRHQPRRQRRLPWPDATDRTEASGQELPVNLRRQADQRMAKIDDFLQRRAKQIVLTIVARLAHGFPPTANLLSKESRSAQIRNPKTQEN